MLTDRSAGKAVFIGRFDSEEDARQGSQTLDSTTPPGGMRRVCVETDEVVLERQAP